MGNWRQGRHESTERGAKKQQEQGEHKRQGSYVTRKKEGGGCINQGVQASKRKKDTLRWAQHGAINETKRKTEVETGKRRCTNPVTKDEKQERKKKG